MPRPSLRHQVVLVAIAAVALVGSAAGQARQLGFTTLAANGEQVLIYRDEFGVPHVFAETNAGLFEAPGKRRTRHVSFATDPAVMPKEAYR